MPKVSALKSSRAGFHGDPIKKQEVAGSNGGGPLSATENLGRRKTGRDSTIDLVMVCALGATPY
jgi:hypothetical protein